MTQQTRKRTLIVEILSLIEWNETDKLGLPGKILPREGVKASERFQGKVPEGLTTDDSKTLDWLNRNGYKEFKSFKIQNEREIEVLNRLYQNRKIVVKVNGIMVFGSQLPNNLKIGQLIEIKLR